MSKDRLMKVLLAPHVSEKSTNAADSANQVVFKVTRDATKTEIKNAVEMLFEVKVDSVNVMNVKGKTKGRFGGNKGRRAHWRKAYVTLEQGFDIDFMSAE
jgi:large subunit ribosomal protein L23